MEEVGLRVVRLRGPVKRRGLGDQDCGEGHVGTVIRGTMLPHFFRIRTVVVQWDSGHRENYRIGSGDAFDLLILDNAPLDIKHPEICKSCGKDGITGMRWECMQCCNFNLCSHCYMSDKHSLTHQFRRFEIPQMWDGTKMPKRRGCEKLQMKGIFPSAKVTRGPDWDWGDQDGGIGKVGTVLNIRGWADKSAGSVATVKWPSGFTSIYRVGYNGKVDLKCTEAAVGGYYYKDHLPVLKPFIYDKVRTTEIEDWENVDDWENVTIKDAENEKCKHKDDKVRTNKTEDCENVTIKEAENQKCEHKGFIELSQSLEDLFTSGQFCDFTVIVKNHKFKVHKAILGARSSVFASMLQHDMKEKNAGIVEISDCDPDIFKDFLFYLYTGKTERISRGNVTGLYEAAEKYDVQGLKEECAHFIKESLSVDIICDVMTLAITYTDRTMTERATEYFISNAQEILLTVKWQIFVKEHPILANELYIKAFSTVVNKN